MASFFDTSTIKSGTVTFNDGMPETLLTGLTVRDSQAVGNSDNGILVFDSTAADVTLEGDTIAENIGDGVFIFDSDISDFAIQNSYLGEAPNGSGNFLGNGATGFDATVRPSPGSPSSIRSSTVTVRSTPATASSSPMATRSPRAR